MNIPLCGNITSVMNNCVCTIGFIIYHKCSIITYLATCLHYHSPFPWLLCCRVFVNTQVMNDWLVECDILHLLYPVYHFKFHTCCSHIHNSVTFFVVSSFICKNAEYMRIYFFFTINSEMFLMNFVIVLSELSVKHVFHIV